MKKETIQKFLDAGKLKELEFCKLFSDDDVVLATPEQDMKEHWDVMIRGTKYDVKGIKKVNRNDNEGNEDIHWLEIKNVNKQTGWAYGGADRFAFEVKDYWILVEKSDLQGFISENVNKKVIVSKPELYHLYRRNGRQDLIVLVKTMDLCYLSTEIIKKPRQLAQ